MNNSTVSLAPPRQINMINTENNGTQAMTVTTPVPMLRRELSSVRGSRNDRSSLSGLTSFGLACLTSFLPFVRPLCN